MVEAAPLIRLFFALDLPCALKAELAAWPGRGRTQGAWLPPENLHLTLAFLGGQPLELLPVLREVGRQAADGAGALSLCTGPLGGFPRLSHARVLWLGLEPDPRLEALAAGLRRDLEARGFVLDRKPFAAHLTLARFRTPTDLRSFAPGPEARSFEARNLVLYRSHLEARGARYEQLETFPFTPRPCDGRH